MEPIGTRTGMFDHMSTHIVIRDVAKRKYRASFGT